MSRKSRTLEIEEDHQFQEKEYVYQRIGLALLFAFVIAAFLGFTGMGGPLSRGEAGERGGPIHVEYERVVRRGGSSTMVLHLRSAPGDTRFWVSAPYFRHAHVASIEPVPELAAVETNRHVYTIRTGSSDVTVMIRLEHDEAGVLDAEIGLVDGPSVRFRQLAIF